jgi:hypothetical protein
MITPPIPTTGLSGYSLEETIREVLAVGAVLFPAAAPRSGVDFIFHGI